jgi:hypothetical protein
LLITLIIVITGLLIYYFAYYRNQKPTTYTDPMVYRSLGMGIETATNVPMMTPEQIKQFVGENFTISMFIKITNLGGSTPNKLVPFVWIVGVGALVVDMTSGRVYVVITSAPVDAIIKAPTSNIILVNGTNAGQFVNKWNQVSLTIGGSSACVYLNGNMVGNCISLTNVPVTAPSGVYFLKGQGPPMVITSFQAWIKPLSAAEIVTNYTNTADSDGSPVNTQSTGASFSDMGTTLVSLFCQTGLCPPPVSNDVRLGPFTKINYEYS